MLVIIVLSILIPVTILSLFSYTLIYEYVKTSILKAQQESLDYYVSQVDSSLENMEQDMQNLLYGRDWGDLLGSVGSFSYEKQKVILLRELKLRVEERGNGKADAIGCYIYNTGDYVFAYNRIPYQDSLWIREYEVSSPEEVWVLVSVNGDEYLHLKYENTIMTAGAMIKSESFIDDWNSSSDFRMIYGEEEGNTDEYLLTSSLSKADVMFTVHIPKSYVKQAMPFQISIMALTVVALFLIIFLILFLLKKYFTKPLEDMAQIIQRIKDGEKELRITGCGQTRETGAIEDSFNSLMDQIYQLELGNYKIEIENQKAQLMNLQLQINPHLLLNTLNTIYGLAEIEEYKDIQNFTMNLVKYFRYSLKRTDELVMVRQELDFIKNYVEVQKIRYPENFYVIYDVDSSIMEELIPPLVIENFVENSIKYSIGKSITEVLVILKKRENRLSISVCDDGIGIEESVLEQLRQGKPYEKDGETHIGVYNCIRRLKLFYGDQMKFSITSRLGEGTQIWMEIPCRKREGKDEFITGR